MSAEEYDEQADLKRLQEEVNGTSYYQNVPKESAIIAVYMNDGGKLCCQLPTKKPEWMSYAQYVRWTYAQYKLYSEFIALDGADKHINAQIHETASLPLHPSEEEVDA